MASIQNRSRWLVQVENEEHTSLLYKKHLGTAGAKEFLTKIRELPPDADVSEIEQKATKDEEIAEAEAEPSVV